MEEGNNQSLSVDSAGRWELPNIVCFKAELLHHMSRVNPAAPLIRPARVDLHGVTLA